MLISGLHRLEAVKALGGTHIPAFVLDVSEQEAQLLEIDENLARNELSILERAEHLCLRKEIYERLRPDTRKGGSHENQHTGGKPRQSDNVSFSQTTAALTQKSGRTIQRQIRLGRLLTPKTSDLLRETDWANNQRALTTLSKLPAVNQESVAEKLASGEAKTTYEAIAKVNRETRNARPCSLPLEGKDYHLFHGDFREVGQEVESNSIDLILSDAPYEQCYLNLFEPLSLFASRVLRYAGSLILMMGQSHLPQVMQSLGTHLNYHWLSAVMMGKRRPLIKGARVISGYKPLLWYVKGRYGGHAIPDVIWSDGYDKDYHDHGQSVSESSDVIKHLTEHGATVLDPFVGGGSVAAAALELGRKFVGIDIDRKAIETTRRRIGEIVKRQDAT